jgi:hypothetical protein
MITLVVPFPENPEALVLYQATSFLHAKSQMRSNIRQNPRKLLSIDRLRQKFKYRNGSKNQHNLDFDPFHPCKKTMF